MNKHPNSSRIFLVTGASSGIGKAIATRLIQDGFDVIAAARRVDKMNDLRSMGAKIIALDIQSNRR